jgi:hypothetical protein
MMRVLKIGVEVRLGLDCQDMSPSFPARCWGLNLVCRSRTSTATPAILAIGSSC